MNLPALTPAWAYSLAVGSVVLTTGLVWMGQKAFGGFPVDLPLFFPIMVTALLGGRGAAFTSAILATMATGLLETGQVTKSEAFLREFFMLGLGSLIAFVGAEFHTSRNDKARIKELEARLYETNQLKNESLAALAHRIRNLLTPVLTAADLLKEEGGQDPSMVAWASATIDRQVKQLNQIIGELLDKR